MPFKKPLFWDYKKISLWSILLFPFSIIYLAIIWIKKESSAFKTYKKPPITVICVGNIYLGGTGKTPLVKEIYNITKSLGKNPSIVKKNYDYLSDEIKMLRDVGETYTNHKRSKSISLSVFNNHDVAILDDGFQDFSIKSDFSILCFNSKQMIGNGLVIPSGPLREKLNAISRADCIIINGNKNLEFEQKLFKNIRNKKLHLFYSKYKIRNVEKFKNKKITAFAGIGNPSNFFDLLKENNLNIKKTYSFPDHHNYSKKDFEKINNDKSTKIITTEKDYYRMNDLQKQSCDYVKIDLEIENKDKFKNIIKSYL
tara:strand:+ start:5342 stop:6277 length:936 start_codon:yes stop_codon:yes gene_type:complete